MKRSILISTFLFFAASAFTQNDNYTAKPLPTVTFYKTYGYINGIRLDSLDAVYCNYGWRSDELVLDYGQVAPNRKSMVVTNKQGEPFIFPDNNRTMLVLNFLYYNGWELTQAYSSGTYAVDYIFKKRTNK